MSQVHKLRQIILSTRARVHLSSGHSWAHTGNIWLPNCQLWTSAFKVFIRALSFLPSVLCQLSFCISDIHVHRCRFSDVNFSRALEVTIMFTHWRINGDHHKHSEYLFLNVLLLLFGFKCLFLDLILVFKSILKNPPVDWYPELACVLKHLHTLSSFNSFAWIKLTTKWIFFFLW